ncbi:MAG: ribonuclease J [Patescibacteria group bacterium]
MSKLKIIPLGGMGRVTQNMYLYEYENEILIVDCGIGFPDFQMYGVDIILPDISYLLEQVEQGKQIVGMILSHGHDDHIAATGYLIPKLPKFPIYASGLTAGFAQNRMKDMGVKREIEIVKDGQLINIGNAFSYESLAVTHSVPDTKHLIINTPEGKIYHGTDFKLDESPVDGVKTNYARMKSAGEEGLLCVLLDCLRVEQDSQVPSESTTGPVLREAMQNVKGKILATMMSSHLHRIQQTIDIAVEQNRKVVFVGRSVEQNIEIALRLKKLHIPAGTLIDKSDLDQYRDEQLCIIIAGSQGQEGSSLVRAVYGEHREVSIGRNDKVIFSAGAIPGNEVPYYKSIDELAHNKVDVAYPDINPGIHQSGHGSAHEQRKVLELLKPKYVIPIGGADRHRNLFVKEVAMRADIKEDRVLLPETGEVIAFENENVSMTEVVKINPQTVDGLGIGDVGPAVLSDRKALSESGMVVVVIPRVSKRLRLRNVEIISRGFVFMKEADEVIHYIKSRVADIVDSLGKKASDAEIKKAIEKRLGRSLYKVIKREPIILAVIVDC